MEWWQTGILAIVEGITEFLPISSTAHLLITSRILGLPVTEFVKSFEIAIQLGAILAVAAMYRKQIMDPKLWGRLLAGWVPTAAAGAALYPFIKGELLENLGVTIAALFAGGIILILLEKSSIFKVQYSMKKTADLPLWKYLIIGVFQAMSIVPGVSRAAATIIGGMMVGLSRREAVEYSFILAVPTMAAAVGWDLFKSGGNFGRGEWVIMAVGFAGAFVSAAAAVKWLISYVRTRDLSYFGWYRIILGAVINLIFIFR